MDTNIARVVARLHALERPSKQEVREIALAMTPADRPGDFVQAMMDLGATVCRPRQPRCGRCPLAGSCLANASGKPAEFPAPKPRRIRPLKRGVAWWIERDGRVWLVRRPSRGMLGGMAALPGTDWSGAPHPALVSLATVHHVFTHFALDLVIVAAREPVGEGWWHPLERIADAGLPTLYRKAAVVVTGLRRELAA